MKLKKTKTAATRSNEQQRFFRAGVEVHEVERGANAAAAASDVAHRA